MHDEHMKACAFYKTCSELTQKILQEAPDFKGLVLDPATKTYVLLGHYVQNQYINGVWHSTALSDKSKHFINLDTLRQIHEHHLLVNQAGGIAEAKKLIDGVAPFGFITVGESKIMAFSLAMALHDVMLSS